jgi:hypothetical protein
MNERSFFDGGRNALKGAFRTLSDLNAPFKALEAGTWIFVRSLGSTSGYLRGT